jgi:hypothetical protein
MKKYPTGLIVLDTIDIICISFSAGSGIAYLVKLYRKYKKNIDINEDAIIRELKQKSSITMFSEKGKPLKVPLVRGGDDDKIKGISILIKNRKLRKIVKAIVNAKRKQKQLRLLREFFVIFNVLLTYGFGLRFAVGGSLDFTQFILIAFPSTVGGFLMGLASAYPIFGVLVPLAILYGRGIEDIADPYERCRLMCKAAEEYHNRQLAMEMENFNSLVEDAATALQLPLDKVPLLCVEEKLSLLQRYKLKEVIKTAKAQKRIQHFSEFIKKFPECEADPEAVYEEVLNSRENLKFR